MTSTHVSSVKRRPKKGFLKRKMAPFLLLSPAVVLVLVVLGYPMLRQFIMSFQKFGLEQQFGKPPKWVGFDNYKAILSDSYFWSVLAKSLAFCAWTAGITMIGAITLALMMRAASPAARTFMNSTLIVVWAMPLLASLTVWQFPLGGSGPSLQRICLALSVLLDLLLGSFGHHYLGVDALGCNFNLCGRHSNR